MTGGGSGRMRPLHISGNGRYFEYQDGTPFPWIADTVWTLPQRIKADDVDYLMRKRREQGFTMLQIAALDPERDEEMRSPAGEPALVNGDLLTPNERYFAYLDWTIDRAEQHGLYVLLLPVWGQLVTGDNWMGGRFNIVVDERNAYEYARWLGHRYHDHPNVLWCLGGDRQPLHEGKDYRDIWRRMAEGLAKGVLGKDLRYDRDFEEWRHLPITYHPSCISQDECSTMSFWNDDEAWIGFVMLQSGHGKESKNWRLVANEYRREHIRPVWDGEPAYEQMPTSWPPRGEFHDSWMVRRRAYWSLFAGAFGYTYGHCSVWSSISEKERNTMFRYDWFDALDAEGANQIRYLRAFIESTDIMACQPMDDSVLATVDRDEGITRHIQVCRDGGRARYYVYLPSGGSVNLQLPDGDSTHWVWWFNPRSGECQGIDGNRISVARRADGIAHVQAPGQGNGQDWIAIIGSRADDGVSVPIIVGDYGESKEEKPDGVDKIFAW